MSLEVGKIYPLVGVSGDALVHRKANPSDHRLAKSGTCFWVRIHLIQFAGLFFLYTADGKYADAPGGPPELMCVEEEFKIEEPEEIFEIGEEEFVV